MPETTSLIHKLLAKFVDRQSIVLEAMRDLRPYIIMPIEEQGTPELWSQLKRKYAQKDGRGYWGDNDEWAYRLHGIGCHLTHTITNEIIGWDVGSLRQFDPNWFIDWLDWLIGYDSESKEVLLLKQELGQDNINRDELRAYIKSLLGELVDLEIIRPRGYRFVLLRKYL